MNISMSMSMSISMSIKYEYEDDQNEYGYAPEVYRQGKVRHNHNYYNCMVPFGVGPTAVLKPYYFNFIFLNSR